jgi:hypothetical protein
MDETMKIMSSLRDSGTRVIFISIIISTLRVSAILIFHKNSNCWNNVWSNILLFSIFQIYDLMCWETRRVVIIIAFGIPPDVRTPKGWHYYVKRFWNLFFIYYHSKYISFFVIFIKLIFKYFTAVGLAEPL